MEEGRARIEVAPEFERAYRQEDLFLSYEAAREDPDWRAPGGLGYMFDGLVVAGWLCWNEARPILSGVEPVSQEVAELVYRLEARSMVGPLRITSGPRRAEDEVLERVFPATVVPREAYARWGVVKQRSGMEENKGSRTGDSPASSRRSRGGRDGQ